MSFTANKIFEMSVYKYDNLKELEAIAKEKGKSVYKIDISFSFRIFELRKCTELHIYYYD